MSYRFEKSESVAEGLKRIAGQQIDKAIDELTDQELDRHDAIHQFRKRAKKIRGLLRLVRPALGDTYQRENQWYRDQARKLSRVRDADALVETADKLIQHASSQEKELLAEAQGHLRARRSHISQEWSGFNDLVVQLRAAKLRIRDWKLHRTCFEAISGGLKKTFRRGWRKRRVAGRNSSNEKLHEWRKRTKYHWHQMRLLRDAWKPVVQARIKESHHLSDLLGNDHDLAVLCTTLLDDPTEFGSPEEIESLMGLMQRQRSHLQQHAHRLGQRLFAEHPSHLVHRFENYWDSWRR